MFLEASSFRDYCSIVAYNPDRTVKRYLHLDYLKHYNHFMESGLYKKLVALGYLVSHTESDSNELPDYPKVIYPESIPFITYPYEWSFSQLKDAALLSLEINKIALEFGMILKDASGYNIQFVGHRPVFIDTASFEIYKIDKPWVAYKQFCRHFLAPLALGSYVDVQLQKLLITHLDGIPLKLCAKLLPAKAMANLGLLLHIFLNAKGEDNKIVFF